MCAVRMSAPWLQDVVPYDPKYLPADAFLSANENPSDVPARVKAAILRAINKLSLNRYPDPLANDLRRLIAEANGLDVDQVLVGNGGDELLFDMALAWGGPGRTFLNIPPTFSVYGMNARLLGTKVVDVPRLSDFTIDQDAVISRVAQGDIDYVIVTSPNNPTGDVADFQFIKRLLEVTDALIMVDEAYFEFSQKTVVPLLAAHDNLIILRTFSKAYSLAGARMGYVMGDASVIREFIKVRQPYSVNAVSQTIARAVFENRKEFELGINAIIEERARVMDKLQALSGVEVFPSEANYILVRIKNASDVWQRLYDCGVLVRDFSRSKGLENCLRITIGSRAENDMLLESLQAAVSEE